MHTKFATRECIVKNVERGAMRIRTTLSCYSFEPAKARLVRDYISIMYPNKPAAS